MYTEYDLIIYQNSITFEKAYNEFELLSGLSILTEDGNEKSSFKEKAKKTFNSIIQAIRDLISKVLDKITSISVKDLFKDRNTPIESNSNPVEVIKENDKKAKKHFSLIEKIKKSKNPSDLSDEVDKTVAKAKEKPKKKSIKKIILTEAIMATATTLIKASLRTYDKCLAKTKEETPIERIEGILSPEEKTNFEKQKLITMLLKSVKGVITDDINSVKIVFAKDGRSLGERLKNQESSDKDWVTAKKRNAWDKMDTNIKATYETLDKVNAELLKKNEELRNKA